MQIGLSFGAAATLFGTMLVLALVPSISVLTVSARAATGGFRHGASVTLGIVVADMVFLWLAMLGLSLLAQTLGKGFVVIQYIGAAYLIWLGAVLWRSAAQVFSAGGGNAGSLWSSFLAGLSITLGDHKAILFYFGFLPAFVDLSAISLADMTLITAMVIASVGSVKLVYAWIAASAGTLIGRNAVKAMNICAATVLIAVGSVILFR